MGTVCQNRTSTKMTIVKYILNLFFVSSCSLHIWMMSVGKTTSSYLVMKDTDMGTSFHLCITVFVWLHNIIESIVVFLIVLCVFFVMITILFCLVKKDTDTGNEWSDKIFDIAVHFSIVLCLFSLMMTPSFGLEKKEKSFARGRNAIGVIRGERGYVHIPNRPPTHLSSVELTESEFQYSLSDRGNPVSVSSDHFEEYPVASDIEHYNCMNSGFKMYKMNSRPRGYILIISNKIFNRAEIRHGTVNDCNRLQDLFEKYLDFVVDVQHNKTAEEMEELIKNLSSLEYLHNMDSLVVVLLSHGFGDSILGTDGNTKNILDLVKLLNGDNCPAMKGKPKMFIVNACRGNVDSGHRSLLDGIVSDVNEVKSPFLDQLPSDSDFVIAYSTFPGALSFRDTEKGSYFIQCLVYIFRQSAHKEHVLDLLTEVNNIMAEKITSEFNIKQIAAPTTTLRKKWYLNPPKPLTSL